MKQKREIIIRELQIAIRKTDAAMERARETIYKLSEKRTRQNDELLLQKLMSWVERQEESK